MDAEPQRIALIVEDDPTLRDILARWLRRRGFITFEAEDNAAAMRHLEQHQPELITTDMYRPGGTGIEFITQVRARTALKQVPILFISGSATAEARQMAKEAGAFADTHKPFDFTELEAWLAMVLPPDPLNSA
jgi:DNA-binding response OmpR family regulator